MITPLETVITALTQVVKCPVVSKVPMERPELFVRVDQGPLKGLSPAHDRATIIVQVYGVDQEKTIELMGVCREFMRFQVTTVDDRVLWYEEIAGPVEFPDPDLPTVHRWQMSGELFTDLT